MRAGTSVQVCPAWNARAGLLIGLGAAVVAIGCSADKKRPPPAVATHCEIVKQRPAPGVGQYLGHIGPYQGDTGFTVTPGDVEIITQVEIRGRDGRSSAERFWHIVRKFGDEWRIIATGGFAPEPD